MLIIIRVFMATAIIYIVTAHYHYNTPVKFRALSTCIRIILPGTTKFPTPPPTTKNLSPSPLNTVDRKLGGNSIHEYVFTWYSSRAKLQWGGVGGSNLSKGQRNFRERNFDDLFFFFDERINKKRRHIRISRDRNNHLVTQYNEKLLLFLHHSIPPRPSRFPRKLHASKQNSQPR